jgi:hypothetical protein
MRTKVKCAVGVVVVLAIYGFGYVMGWTAQQRASTKYKIATMQSYYVLAETGLLDRLKMRLGFRLYAETRACQALQSNRFCYLYPMLVYREPSGDRWQQIFHDAEVFADGYQTNVVVLDKQHLIDEVRAELTNSPTQRSSERPPASVAGSRSP